MAMTVFPNYFVLQATSGGPYLSVPEDLPPSLPSGFLKFEEKQILSPRSKFAAELSQSGDATLVNIRSCYNNKYWVVHKINNAYWVAASASKPQEDQTKPECTLFQPHLGEQGVLLISAGMSMHASTSGGEWTDGLLIGDSMHSFNVVDWETLVILPPQVSFRSEVEGNYLCSRVIETSPYLRFESGLDAGDPHELFPTADGNYRIKDLHTGKFWKRSPSNWVLDDGEENDNESGDFLFCFIKITDSVFALRCLGNNTFCGGATDDGKTNCLNAQYPTISKETRLIVGESVLERYVSNLTYRLSDSRIYYEQSEVVGQATAKNSDPDKEATVTLDFHINGTRNTFWTNSVSSTFGIKVNFNVTNVPFIENGEIQLVTEPDRTYEWGVAETTKSTRQNSYDIVVPPSTTLKITVKRNKAACDVPFSYTQRDSLQNGQIVTSIKYDGIFTGSNSYNYSLETSKIVADDQGRLYL